MTLSDTELERYARHIVLREIGGPGQRMLVDAHVAVVGAGGLGAPALLYLAGAGIGQVSVIDDDVVSLSNLQRQVIFQTSTVGASKAVEAAAAVARLNPLTGLNVHNFRLDKTNIDHVLAEADLVLDCSDNFATRRGLNAYCVAQKKPLVFAALSQWEGQIGSYDGQPDSACYVCRFPVDPDPELAPDCASAGIVGPLAGILGTMMALEAVKIITGAGQVLSKSMLIYDGLFGETRTLKCPRNPECSACGG